MSDAYQRIRELPFSVVASALGIDMAQFSRRKNGEYYGPCPVNPPKTNTTSFSYSAEGVYHCFSCKAKGKGGIDLTMAVRSVNFTQATEILGKVVYEPATEKTPHVEAYGASALKPFKGTYDKYAVPCKWLEDRIPDTAVRQRYGVFCYNNPARKSVYSGNVMIPIRDCKGTMYGYLARTPDKSSQPEHGTQPKYVWPKGLPKAPFLFGAAELCHPDTPHSGHLPLKVLYVVESPFSVLHFASLNLPAVALYGWSASTEQIQVLAQLTRGAVFLPDTNKRQESAQVLPRLASSIWVRFPPLPDGIDDPENLTLEQVQRL